MALTAEQQLAASTLSNAHLHQSTTYESPVSKETLTVSFGTTSNFNDAGAENYPTILYLGPMMCSRYLLSYADGLARMKRTRVIFVERPGFGKSTLVPIEERLQHALACIPRVLSYLRVDHVALMSASAGTLYCLNFLTTPSLRAYLHPQRPYVAALVPWVHPDCSHSSLWSMVERLPAAVIGSCGGLQRFVGTKIMPGIGWSSSVFGSVGTIFGKDDSSNVDQDIEAKTGMTKKQLAAIDEMMPQRMLQEDSSGFGHEALTCLRKNLAPSSWGIATSYPQFVSTLAEQEARRLSEVPPSEPTASNNSKEQSQKLRFRVFFASSDVMIGDQGRQYFDDCFRKCQNLDDCIQYSSTTIEDTNHDSVMDVRKGVLATVFDDVAASWGIRSGGA